MKFDNQLRHAEQIIAAYDGQSPLAGWLKQFFREHRQMGSSDRKQLSDMVYGYFRLGHACLELSVSSRILVSLFLSQHSTNPLLNYFKPGWDEQIGLSVEEKLLACARSSMPVDLASIFPWKSQLSTGIDHLQLCRSFLQKPDLFIRIRPGQQGQVWEQLKSRQPGLEAITPTCLRLPNGSAIDQWVRINKQVVIQDLNSQRTADYLALPEGMAPNAAIAWDCCAASGGKSILLCDKFPGIHLFASDIRPSMLANLNKRLREAAIKQFHAFQADLARPGFRLPAGIPSPDLLLLDAPCSGSGTWGRSPESLYYFAEDRIGFHAGLQQQLIANVLPALRKGGKFTYITCSVFRQENEEAVRFITKEFGIACERSAVLSGYSLRADSMFAALFTA